MDKALEAKVDRSVFSIGRLYDPSVDKEYWRSRKPSERLAALELMRRIVYGYDPTTARLQRLLEIARRP
jgi:hypothetical protein